MKEIMLCESDSATNIDKYKEWWGELKYDGRRVLIEKVGGDIKFLGRHSVSVSQYPEIYKSIKEQENDFIIDTEFIVKDKEGKSDFGLMMSRDRTKDKFKIELMTKLYPATAIVFDILECDKIDLRDRSLEQRKEILLETISPSKSVEIIEISKNPKELLENALENKEEGIVVKKLGSVYEEKRSSNWIKIKRIKQSDVFFNNYEVSNKGITLMNDLGIRCAVNGEQHKEVKRIIDEKGGIVVEINHLGDKKEKYRQPTFSKIKSEV